MALPWTPRPYQNLISAHETGLARGGVWAGMGMGKTISTLTAIDALQLVGHLTRPALVLAPLRVAQATWPDEARKWQHTTHMDVVPITGTPDQRTRALRDAASGAAPVFTTNYENLPWITEQLEGQTWPFGMVVADESTRLKSFRVSGPNGKRARALAKIAHSAVDRWVNLTGTPSPNGLQDLWGQCWFLDKGERLGRSYTGFTSRWFRTGYNGFGLEPLPGAQAEIQTRLQDMHLTVDPRDWFDLDAPITNAVRVSLPPSARLLYRDMEREMFAVLGDNHIAAANAAARTLKCLQIASGAIYVDDTGAWREVHNAKIDALDSIVAEAGGAPVIVAYHFKHDLERLRRAYPHAMCLGDDDDTAATLRAWNSGKVRMLLAHPASAGHGLNLQDGGNILVFFSQWWNLEEHDQIIERIGPVRQKQAGYDRPVFIHYILAADTVDELVMQRRETKRTVQDILLGAMKRKGLE
jgi:SNF2 family DNA or RNA helicase